MSLAEAERILRTQYAWSPPVIDGYTLQVSSFRTLVNAVNFQQHLTRKGYQVYLEVVDLQGAWFRVMVDRFASREEARLAADRFQAKHGDAYKVFVRKR
jgi:septal ring-binding cell division protein DamX